MIDVKVESKVEDFSVRTDICFQRGVCALLGVSGSGKTTTLRMIAGFHTPDRGHIIIEGRTLFDHSRSVNLPPERRRIGYVSQQPSLFPHLSVKDNLLYGYRRFSDKIDLEKVVEILELSHLFGQIPAVLSGGEKQRVSLARALLTGPDLLLLDEPVSALDPERKWKLLGFIKKVTEGFDIPTIYVSHNLDEIEFIAEMVILIENGQTAPIATLEEFLRTEHFLKSTFSERITNTYHTCVEKIEQENGIAVVRLGNKVFKVPQNGLQPGEPILVTIPADEIIVTKEHPGKLSARNIYCGKVKGIYETMRGVAVQIDSGFDVWVEITRESLREFDFREGDLVHYIFKTRSIRVHLST